MKRVFLLFSMLAGSCLAGEGGNLLTCETDFETTAAGWYGWHPGAAVPGRVQDGAVGVWSLEVRGPEAVRTPFVWHTLKPETDYTVSFSAKGDGGCLALALVTTDWRWLGTRTVKLERVWRRYQYTFRSDRKGTLKSAFCLQLEHRAPGEWFRIDGIKIEEGRTATPYRSRAVCLFAALEEPGEIHFEQDGPPVMKVRSAGTRVFETEGRLTAEVLDERGVCQASSPLVGGAAALTLPSAASSGYYPYRTRIRTADGTVLASCETPFVVTRAFNGNDFFGVQSASGVPAAALHRVGFRWLRRNTKFWVHEEKDGPRPLTGAEKVLTRPPDGFRVLATSWGHHAPGWARGEGMTLWTDDVNKATNYLANLVHTTTNVVDCYEVINEPDLTLPREKGKTLADACGYFARIVDLTARYVRPTGKPLAIDVSGCREGNDLIAHVLEKTPGSVDVVAAHPYSWPRELSEDGRAVADPETGGFLNDLNVKTALLKKYGKKRLVIGELGWALDMAASYASRSAEKFGWYLARMYLLARTFPDVEYLIWYSLANAPENGLFDYGLWRSNPADGVRPLPAVAAACEAARRLPARGAGDVKVLSSDGLYVLTWRDGQTVQYAYWTDEPLAVPLVGLTVLPQAACDYTGRGLDRTRLTLSGGPVYLDVAPDRAAAFEAAFLPAAARAYAQRSAPVREEIIVHRFVGDWRTADFASSDACVDLGGKRTDVQPPDPTVQWTGEDDLSARVRLGWDATNFYFFAAVKDDLHCVPKKGYESFRNDVIQLAFDPKDNAKKNSGYLSDDCEFGLCEGMGLFAWRRPGSPGAETVDGDFVRVVRKGAVTEYRAAIPWRVMGLEKAPDACGLAFAVLDNDDHDRARYWLAFGNGIADGKRPARFKRAVFRDAP